MDRDRVTDVFLETLQLPADERAARLSRLCEDPAVVDSVLKLLSSDETSAPSTSREPRLSAIGSAATDPEIPFVIDRFQCVEEIGAGGFGVVYRAVQDRPVRREVAIKVIKRGMDTREVILRFQRERQALALMDHPSLATIFDGGVTPDGRPYFVMELVEGCSITKYVERHELDLEERLRLFLEVCDAVQHAHAKGIIHRDIKPENVLVTDVSGRPVPKVIDFGIAKALDPAETDTETIATRRGSLIGTPIYMSPEQCGAVEHDVDIRTDVHALGTILYELLTGTRPFDPRSGERQSSEDLLARIRFESPDPPSRRLASSSASTDTARPRLASEARRAFAAALRRELDWLVLHCLEKDPERRYPTVAALAADLRRFLAHEPLSARPPSRTYQAQRFVRRHRAAVVGSAAAAIFLVATTAVSLRFAILAERQRDRAATALVERDQALERERAGRQEAVAAQELAEERNAVLDQLVDYMTVDLFEAAAPSTREGQGIEVTLVEAVVAGAERLRAREDLDPAVRLELLLALGTTLESLSLFDESTPLLEDAFEISSGLFGPTDSRTLTVLANLLKVYFATARYDESIDIAEAFLQEHEASLGPSGHFILHRYLAMNHEMKLDYDLAVREYEIADRFSESADISRASRLRFMNDRAILHRKMGELDVAEQIQRDVLRIREDELGPYHRDSIATLNNLANTLLSRGTSGEDLPGSDRTAILREAVELFHECLDRLDVAFPPIHRERVFPLINIAISYRELGDPRAETAFEAAIAMADELYADAHWFPAAFRHEFALLLRDSGRTDDALEVTRASERIALAVLGPEDDRSLAISKLRAELEAGIGAVSESGVDGD